MRDFAATAAATSSLKTTKTTGGAKTTDIEAPALRPLLGDLDLAKVSIASLSLPATSCICRTNHTHRVSPM